MKNRITLVKRSLMVFLMMMGFSLSVSAQGTYEISVVNNTGCYFGVGEYTNFMGCPTGAPSGSDLQNTTRYLDAPPNSTSGPISVGGNCNYVTGMSIQFAGPSGGAYLGGVDLCAGSSVVFLGAQNQCPILCGTCPTGIRVDVSQGLGTGCHFVLTFSYHY